MKDPIDKMNRTDLHKQPQVSKNAIATMRKGGDGSTKGLSKICQTLICRISDIVDYIPEGVPWGETRDARKP